MVFISLSAIRFFEKSEWRLGFETSKTEKAEWRLAQNSKKSKYQTQLLGCENV